MTRAHKKALVAAQRAALLLQTVWGPFIDLEMALDVDDIEPARLEANLRAAFRMLDSRRVVGLESTLRAALVASEVLLAEVES